MKLFNISVFFFLGLAGLDAQTLTQFNVTASPATAYRVVERGLNHRLWQRQTYEASPDGTIITNVHQYTELASGMYYTDTNGQLLESKEIIESYPQGAIARQGQQQVIFANNLNSYGAIDMLTPDGKRLRSSILGLMYYDTSTGEAVLIAEVQDSTGELIADNQVLYPNAFDGARADVRYTYRRGGFEQDVILREQPPSPQSFGLNPTTTELEVFTEFIDPPPARVVDTGSNGPNLEGDQDVSWGAVSLSRSKAFTIGGEDQAPVHKQYVILQGRYFLVEKVPIRFIQKDLSNLPQQSSNEHKLPYFASKAIHLPQPRPTGRSLRPITKLAGEPSANSGYVMDYMTVNASFTNYTFQGDSTYYISGAVNLSGTTTIEGGAVIKYAHTNTVVVNLGGNLKCQTGPYRLAVLTSADDNSEGETISGSSGNPTNANSGTYFSSGNSQTLAYRYLRLSFAGTGLAGTTFTNGVWHCQFVQCQTAVSNSTTSDVFLRNVLFGSCNTAVASSGCVYGEHVTADEVGAFASGSVTGGALTNCMLTGVISLSTLTAYNSAQYSSGSGVYQSVGAGDYYLAAGSTNRDSGATNIDAILLADLKKKTTYPPTLSSNVLVSTSTTLGPQAGRDTDVPDLGYHYDPIDYLVDTYTVTNCTLTLTNGVSVGCLCDAGFNLRVGAAINSIGTANNPNWVTTYNLVQEQPIKIGTSAPIAVLPFSSGTTAPSAHFNFTKFSWLAGSAGHQLFNSALSSGFGTLGITNCEFRNGANEFGGIKVSSTTIQNCLFVHGTFRANASDYPKQQTGSAVHIVNCTFHGGPSLMSVTINAGNNTSWTFLNNCGDSIAFVNTAGSLLINYNAYFNCSNAPSGSGNLSFTNPPTWYSSHLGDFYQPTDTNLTYGVLTPLTDAGSTTADQLGLYHFTTQTNQTVDGTSQVDIGYHYVAADANGNLFDSDGDGIPDYLEDANGNGIFDTGDVSDWLLNAYNGLNAANRLQVYTLLK